MLARSDLEKSEALVISLTVGSRFLIFDDSRGIWEMNFSI